jgi:hypothetical protein
MTGAPSPLSDRARSSFGAAAATLVVPSAAWQAQADIAPAQQRRSPAAASGVRNENLGSQASSIGRGDGCAWTDEQATARRDARWRNNNATTPNTTTTPRARPPPATHATPSRRAAQRAAENTRPTPTTKQRTLRIDAARRRCGRAPLNECVVHHRPLPATAASWLAPVHDLRYTCSALFCAKKQRSSRAERRQARAHLRVFRASPRIIPAPRISARHGIQPSATTLRTRRSGCARPRRHCMMAARSSGVQCHRSTEGGTCRSIAPRPSHALRYYACNTDAGGHGRQRATTQPQHHHADVRASATCTPATSRRGARGWCNPRAIDSHHFFDRLFPSPRSRRSASTPPAHTPTLEK